ncbi:bifunctional 4-hydroxy-2-oxoglutarate aldolase/2-dehydro-3-deoxy-phosphogluconate aldolase [Streptomyces litchfieldiae]|uniref:Bifunctional 4-hydroxy-2-oxoglutarate aldolase/2-dehydro-3-deoxy-phosphogluconate aldolase n=1 Tax=Streptomyces litchfieldiae TaxID=3075543 RepID=A0ABU2MQQ3_9ACTN|nr:bifunctional 4-hydroxy-2-oxoglutarate aldolase/2-dehydro-3-deoxy-phosphogluconate aldolase [Streptomyces sp. DSM 44938]MDT0343801.1 bifunctional 4-hydroxy-2-oxoglutarate aldolase/2-dehydro-3-deoxy-phosphogluconate aldolase [Streptomyces sp. DSM 44938]
MTDFFERAFAAGPVMGIFRGYDPGRTVEMCHRAWELGIDLVEVPVQDPSAVPSLTAAVAAARERGKVVGAGTVTSVEQVREVALAGAAFTVAPGLLPEVAAACADRELPHLPGVATATEISRARALGLHWLKAFPAAQLGADWIRAQRGPFPDVEFVATGGLDARNAGAFLAAGCRGVAVGSALADPDQLPLLAGLMGGTA